MTTADRNFANRTLFHGDNLLFLQGMNGGTVDLIATDPPFNKGKDFHATPESLAAGARFQDRWSWEDDVQQEWVDAIKDDEPDTAALIEYVKGRREDLAAFLCFMGVRLIEMRRVLKDTGSIYLHCDPTASHYLKALMDAVFGDKNFRNEIIWERTTGKGNATKGYANNQDSILYYTNGNTYAWTTEYLPLTDERIKTHYRKVEEGSGRRYSDDNLTSPSAGGFMYEWNGVCPKNGWRWKKERMQAAHNAGLLYYTKNGTAREKRYLDERKGSAIGSVWTDIRPLNSQAKERTGYPTQKPLALYERIIKASSNPGDMVLDPFCGCATTPIAAERLGRQWIGMDLWDGAYDIVRRRMADNRQLLADPDPRIVLRDKTDPPVRTDLAESDYAPAPSFETPTPRAKEAWERLSHAQMREILYEAQEGACGGCGRELEIEFMELDHLLPRADGGANDITNRVMLCAPCNRRKSHRLTISGLTQQNRREGWMRDERRAKRALDLARRRAERIKNGGEI